LGIGPNPQSPNPKPQYPINSLYIIKKMIKIKYIIYEKKKKKIFKIINI